MSYDDIHRHLYVIDGTCWHASSLLSVVGCQQAQTRIYYHIGRPLRPCHAQHRLPMGASLSPPNSSIYPPFLALIPLFLSGAKEIDLESIDLERK